MAVNLNAVILSVAWGLRPIHRDEKLSSFNLCHPERAQRVEEPAPSAAEGTPMVLFHFPPAHFSTKRRSHPPWWTPGSRRTFLPPWIYAI